MHILIVFTAFTDSFWKLNELCISSLVRLADREYIREYVCSCPDMLANMAICHSTLLGSISW